MEISDGAGKVAEKCVMEALNILSPMRVGSKSRLEFDELMRKYNALQAVETAIEDTDDEPDTQMQYKICGGMNNHYWNFNDNQIQTEVIGIGEDDDVPLDELLRKAEELMESNSKDDRKAQTVRSSSMPCYSLRSQSRKELFFSQPVGSVASPIKRKTENGERKTRPRGVYGIENLDPQSKYDSLILGRRSLSPESGDESIGMATDVINTVQSNIEDVTSPTKTLSLGDKIEITEGVVQTSEKVPSEAHTESVTRNVVSDMEDDIVDVETVSEDDKFFEEAKPSSKIKSQNNSNVSWGKAPAKRIGLGAPSGSKKDKDIPSVPIRLGLSGTVKMRTRSALRLISNIGKRKSSEGITNNQETLPKRRSLVVVVPDCLANESAQEPNGTSGAGIETPDDASVRDIETAGDASRAAIETPDEDVSSPAHTPHYGKTGPADVETKVVVQDNNSMNVAFKRKGDWAKSYNTGILSEPTSRDDEQSQSASPNNNGATDDNANVESEIVRDSQKPDGDVGDEVEIDEIGRDKESNDDASTQELIRAGEQLMQLNLRDEQMTTELIDDLATKTIKKWNNFDSLRSPPLGSQYNIEWEDTPQTALNSAQEDVNPPLDDNEEPSPLYSPLRVNNSRVPSIVSDVQSIAEIADVQNEDESSAPSIANGKRITVVENLLICGPTVDICLNAQDETDLGAESRAEYWEVAEFQPQLILPKEKVRLSVTTPLKFVQPIQPAVINVLGMSTRALTTNNYDDTDESQNELIGMERSGGNTSRVALCGRAMPMQRKFQLFQQLCKKFKLPPPLPIEQFESIDWDYVPKCDEGKLMANFQLKTLDELESIPRRHPKFPFCHPGPVREGNIDAGKWYYADSIIQKLKFIGCSETFYNVRWIGYEDKYNTVEPERSLKGAAILILFQRPGVIPASQASGPLLLRRSTRLMNKIVETDETDTRTSMAMTKPLHQNESFAQAMAILDKHLQVEENEGRFLPNLGFYSYENIKTSLNHQLDFIENVFHPLMKNLKRPQYYLSTKYLGSFFGQIRDKELEKEFGKKAFDDPGTVKKLIFEGLKIAGTDEENGGFVSFFVATKRHGKQRADANNLDMHMCVYTVRAHDGQKDSIYFDPAAPCHERTVPDFLRELRKPALRSATVKSGQESQANDCLYQCLKYIIGLQTGEIAFEPNPESKYFRITKDV